MWGALIGDGVGSPYEFAPYRAKEGFDIYSSAFHFTDDSVMTIAVMDVLAENAAYDERKLFAILRQWGRRYPNAGYGGFFRKWLGSTSLEHGHSFGNGAAMRISPVGWAANSEKEAVSLSRAITACSHDTPEALKAAEVLSLLIFRARQGKDKESLCASAREAYSLYPSRAALLKANQGHGAEIASIAMPQALSAFFLSSSFDDCLRLIILAGGDCDTTGAIACSLAEAYYQDSDPRLIELAKKGFAEDREAMSLLTSSEYRDLFHDR
jgi:ADP-ribosylglycohydrolase